MNRHKHTKTKEMTLVFAKIQLELIDQFPDFFSKLKAFVGHFRIEAQSVTDTYEGILTVSFYTDKVEIPLGDPKSVFLKAKILENGTWEFTGIEK